MNLYYLQFLVVEVQILIAKAIIKIDRPLFRYRSLAIVVNKPFAIRKNIVKKEVMYYEC